MDIFEERVIVSGIGISRVARRSGRDSMSHALEAIRAAVADAGLRPADIDGIATMGDTPAETVKEALGLSVAWTGGLGSGAQLSAFINGAMSVGAGLTRHCLVYRDVGMMGGTLGPGGPGGGGRARGWGEWLLPFGAFSAANWLAMNARRHMHQYGTTKEQLGWVAVNARRHAALNDLATYREPMTIDDYLGARPITDPFGLYDCDVPVDGAVAVVVSPTGYAADCPNPPVRLRAVGCALRGRASWDQREDYPSMAATDAAAQMWSRTDLRPAEVDVAELYDGFTYLTLEWLEALEFCGRGESGPFVAGGERIGLGGELPLNTYGGQLSAGRLHGYWLLHEACLQLRHQAGPRQVPGAQVAVAAAGGGPLGGCLLLSR